MSIIEQLVKNYYADFAGLPNQNPIVRNNIPEDAFTLAILEIMYSHSLEIKITPDNIDKISQIGAGCSGGVFDRTFQGKR